MKRLIKIAEKYSTVVEEVRVPLGYYILAFVVYVALRNFLEIFSDRSELAIVSLDLHVHFYLFYICMALSMMLLFVAATGEKVAKIARLVLLSFYFIFLAPLFDLIISGGQGSDMAYLLPNQNTNLLLRYLTLGGKPWGAGITTGLKLEGILLLIASFFYFKAKKVPVFKISVFIWLIYTVVFAYAIVPFVIKAILDVFHLFEGFDDGNMLFIRFYLIVILTQLLVMVWLWNKQYFVSLLKDLRLLRQAHALMMLAFGIILGPALIVKQDTFFDLPLVVISIVLACLFVIMTNNLEDQEIDRRVNKTRPLVSGAIPCGDYRNMAVGAGLLALLFAAAVSYYAFFTILLSMGLYCLYSLPPVRLKRVPFFSKLPIALSSLAVVILGYVLAGGEIIEFPPLIIVWFLVFFTAAMNFIDIKDYEGDKRAGIQTLPVLWGLAKSQRIIGLFFLLAYVAAPFAVRQIVLLIPAIGAGVLQFWLINRKDYQEKWAFGLYLTSFVILLLILVLGRVSTV